MSQKSKIFNFLKKKLCIFKVGHPGTSSMGVKILSRRSFVYKLSRNLIDFGIKNNLKIDTKKLVRTDRSTLGDLLGTPWGPPGSPGAEIDDFGGRFGTIFDPQSIKFDENLPQNRRIKRPRS